MFGSVSRRSDQNCPFVPFVSWAIFSRSDEGRDVAGKTQAFSFQDVSAERLWIACVQAVGLLGFNVIHSDKDSGQLSFNTGRSMSSWAGQDLTATVINPGSGSQLVMGGSLAKGGNPLGGGSQIGSWGEKGRLISKYAEKVTEILPGIAEPEAASAAPTSAADELAKLAQLRDSGVLTADEFEAQKAKLLA